MSHADVPQVLRVWLQRRTQDCCRRGDLAGGELGPGRGAALNAVAGEARRSAEGIPWTCGCVGVVVLPTTANINGAFGGARLLFPTPRSVPAASGSASVGFASWDESVGGSAPASDPCHS